jgi:uncharacterized protein YdeI (YjbR/CyaY-like superfamily)
MTKVTTNKTSSKVSDGVVHTVPTDLKKVLLSSSKVLDIWEDITPLARNEWICWIIDAKKLETRERRIKIMLDKFSHGERRPCCWAGCIHRTDKKPTYIKDKGRIVKA